MAQIFWKIVSGEFKELSENHTENWIISIFHRDIRDFLKYGQKSISKFYYKSCENEMSRTTTYIEIRPAKLCCTKVELCIRLCGKLVGAYFGTVMTSSKSRKTTKIAYFCIECYFALL